MEDKIQYIAANSKAFVIEINPHIVKGLTALEYAEKLFSGDLDTSIIEEMVDSDTIIKVKAWVGDEKVSCSDFDLYSAIDSVYEAIVEKVNE